MLCVVLPITLVLVFIAFPMINQKIKVSFVMYPNEESADYVGERFNAMTANAGASVKLPVPIRPGYLFEGWAKDENGKEKVGASVKSSMKLYACWSIYEPTAHFFVDGIDLKHTATIPHPDRQNTTNALGPDFVPKLDWAENVLGAYDLADFFGYWYYDSKSAVRREIRLEDNQWWHWKQVENDTSILKDPRPMSSTNPFFPKHDIALNAMFGKRHNQMPSNLPDNDKDNIIYAKNRGKVMRIMYKKGADTIGTEQSARFCEDIVLNSAATVSSVPLAQRCGWKIEVDPTFSGDVLGLGLVSTSKYFTKFYVSPLLFDKMIVGANGIPTLTLNLVTSQSATESKGVWDKSMSSNGIRIDRTADSDGSVIVREFSPWLKTAEFDFGGDKRGAIKDVSETKTSQEDLAKGQKYPNADGNDLNGTNNSTRVVPISANANYDCAYDGGKVSLLLPSDFVVAGLKFGGWKCNIDGKVYPAGTDFFVPRGYFDFSDIRNPRPLDLKFTATWVKI